MDSRCSDRGAECVAAGADSQRRTLSKIFSREHAEDRVTANTASSEMWGLFSSLEHYATRSAIFRALEDNREKAPPHPPYVDRRLFASVVCSPRLKAA